MIRKVVALTLAGLFGIVLFIFVGNWIGVDGVWNAFQSFTLPVVLAYLLISVLIFSGHVWRWWIIVRSYGYKVPFLAIFRYRLEGYAASYITPSAFVGGEPLRAYLLKAKHDVPYTKSISSIVIDKNFELVVNGFFVIIGIFLLFLNFALPKQFEVIIAGGILFAMATLAFFYRELLYQRNILLRIFHFFKLDKVKKLKKFEKRVIELEKQIHTFFAEHKRVCVYIFTSMILMWVLVFLEYYLALTLIGVDPTFMLIFLVFAMVGISFIVPIPGGLGVLESTQASVFSLYGSTAAAGVALSLVVRARDMIWVFLGLCGVGVHGIKQFYRFIIGKEELK